MTLEAADVARSDGRPPRTRRRSVAILSVVAITASVVALFGFGLSRDPTLIRSVLVGKRAPDFALPTVDGKGTMRLSDLRGQVVVVNFWASWCAACRQEHPNFAAAWSRYRDQGVVILGIVFQDSAGAAADYMRQAGGGWPVLTDPGSRTAQRYGVYGVPETFFIDATGRIAFKRVGYSSYELLTRQIGELLARRATPS